MEKNFNIYRIIKS